MQERVVVPLRVGAALGSPPAAVVGVEGGEPQPRPCRQAVDDEQALTVHVARRTRGLRCEVAELVERRREAADVVALHLITQQDPVGARLADHADRGGRTRQQHHQTEDEAARSDRVGTEPLLVEPTGAHPHPEQ